MLPFRQYHLHQLFSILSEASGPLDLTISQYFRDNRALGSKDRKSLAETLYTMTRNLGLLDFFIKGEKTWPKRFEVFQNIDLDKVTHDTTLPLHTRLSFPKIILDKWIEAYGEKKAEELARLSNERAPITLRVNTCKISREEFLEKLKPELEMRPTSVSACGVEVLKRVSLFQLKAFKEGLFEMQDEASQLLADLVAAKPGEKVLDFCSGSGGKALAIAPQMQGRGVLYLHDIRKGILYQAKKRLKRAGIQHAQILSSGCTKKLRGLEGNMDWVLLDAPCSGSGTYRRNPDLKWKFTEEMLNKLKQDQRDIFAQALKYLKPNGRLVFATCSLFKEENEEQVNYFLKSHPVTLDKELFSSLDHFETMDGFFGAVFKLK